MNLCLLLVFTLGAAFFNALTIKAGIGVYACWESISVTVAEITSLKVSTFGIIMNSICIFIQILILKKQFPPIGYLQLPYVFIYGTFVNFFYYNVLKFQLHIYIFNLLLCIISIVGVSFFLGCLNSLNLLTISVESTCKLVSDRLHLNFAALRVGLDVSCVVISLGLSFLFHLPLAIREGTVLCTFLLGPLEKYFMDFRNSTHNAS